MKRITIVSTLVAAVALVAAAVGGAAAKPGFPPGTWVGTGTQKGLFTVVGEPSPVDGTAAFTLKVDRSSRATGTLTLRTRMSVDHAGLRGIVTGAATVPLSGSGSAVGFAGTMKLTGKLTDGKLTVPFTVAKPFSGRFLIGRASCLSVTGKTDSKLAFRWRAVPKPGTPRPRCA